jgi:hypothetical protein
MTSKRQRFSAAAAVGLTILAVIFVLHSIRFSRAVRIGRELGLRPADISLGGTKEIAPLHAKAKKVADAFLGHHAAELQQLCGGTPYTLAVDYSLASTIQQFGYQSSYYYYCWDIHLPYALQPLSGAPHIVVVKMTDSIQGNKRDLAQLRVLQADILDQSGHVVRTLR